MSRIEHILIVEDEASIRKALEMSLSSDEYKVDVAADGNGGILKSSGKEYDILIADLCLPDMDGLEVIKKVKRISPEIIPIVITGNASIESSIEAIHLEVSDYLQKPFTTESVKYSIKKGIKKRNQKQKTMRKKLNHILNVYKEENDGNIETESDTQNTDFKQLSEKLPMLVHQINNPLTAISGSAQLALFDLNDNKLVKEYLTNIIKATEKIGTVNKEIMKLSRSTEDETEKLNIKTLLEECLFMFNDLLFIKRVRVETVFKCSGLLVKGNQFKLEQIFNNLFLNAIDSMDGRPEKVLKVYTTFDKDTLMISTLIKDTGCGIPKESMEKIFTKYFSKKKHGTGLGLPVVKSFVEEQKGKIQVESVVGEGTSFIISFPVEVRNLAMRSADAAKDTAELIEGTVKKVNDGSELVNKTNETFSKVAESSSKVGELVGEIAAASNEQSQGIEQVNTAVAEMDKVVQTNSANSEETAAASEEMNAQAEQMKGFVANLAALVGGSANGRGNGQVSVVSQPKSKTHKLLMAAKMKASAGKMAVIHEKEVKPNQVIPLDDADFQDF